jgi:AGCS family alanine or glycine:cation symporter
MVAFFWSKYRFVEATLAQIYKEKHLGEFRGPAFISKRIRREMVCCFVCRGFYHFGRCYCLVQRTLLQMEYRMPLNMILEIWNSSIIIFGAIVFGGVKESQIYRICRSIMAIILNCIGDDSDGYRSTSWSYRFSFKSAFNMEAGLEPFWFSSSMGCKEDLF